MASCPKEAIFKVLAMSNTSDLSLNHKIYTGFDDNKPHTAICKANEVLKNG
jgi:hypothetical protein